MTTYHYCACLCVCLFYDYLYLVFMCVCACLCVCACVWVCACVRVCVPSCALHPQVGPQPVLTIPDDPRMLGTFDLNHFSVRIMSVDYQAAFPAAGASSSATYSGPRINFTEDSRVVLGDSADGCFAYVQHLTLYDLEARGFVRPFCMAYVSSDQRKLMEHFCELSACFTQASDSLKTGNRRAFATELQRKLQELE